jgi:hypothetical protein
MSLIDQVKEVMSEHTGSAHVDDIAQMVLTRFQNIQVAPEKLSGKISSVLSTDARKKGTVAFANCKYGSTLAISSKGIDLWTLWRLMLWVRTESWKIGIGMNELMRHLRQEIRRRVLSDD